MIPWWNRTENARAALWISLGVTFTGWLVTASSLAWRQILTPGPIAGLAMGLMAAVATWYTNGGKLVDDTRLSLSDIARLRRLQKAHNLTDDDLEAIVGGRLEDFPVGAYDLLVKQINGTNQ
jgi:hypothetical protein